MTKTKSKPRSNKTGTPITVPLEAIELHPALPRKFFNEQRDRALADAIRREELLNRPIVRSLEAGGFQLLAGVRRLRAMESLGIDQVAVTLRECNDVEALRIVGSEQLHHEQWNPIELAQYLKTLCTPPDDGGAGMTREQAAGMFGKAGPWASDHVSLLSLPEAVQALVISGEMPRTTARMLVPESENAPLISAVLEDIQLRPWAWQTRDQAELSIRMLKATKSPVKPDRPIRPGKKDKARFSRKRVELLLRPFASDARRLQTVIEVAQSLLSAISVR